MRGVVPVIIATATLFIAGSAIPEPAAEPRAATPRPLLWVVRDPDSTLYLYGTMHLLSPDAQLGREVELARESAQEVWVETDLSTAGRSEIINQMLALGMDHSRTLSSYLTPLQKKRVYAALSARDLPAARFEQMRPWLAALVLAVAPVMGGSASADSGADIQVSDAAQRTGQRLRAFETAEQQMRLFADLSEAAQVGLLMDTVAVGGGEAGLLDTMEEAWVRGDEAAFDQGFVAELRENYPELYDALLVTRNRAWIATIEQELAGAGVDFMAVGAAHMVGPDGLVNMLRAKGYAVERVGEHTERTRHR